MNGNLLIKIQSISDVITNSSTEVFVVYDPTNIHSIKTIVNAILAIDGNYTFDDLFHIEMTINTDIIYSLWQDHFDFREKYKTYDEFYKYISNLPPEELEEYIDMYRDENYAYSANTYEGYFVKIKDGIERTDKLQKAVDAIRMLDSIFSIDYNEDY